ncbi:MAG: YgiQ family radical SAM protein, partial [Candidatus Hydrothermarchaeota archaeon]
MEEARERGWEELDVVLVTGDAYVDHPSFGPAVIGRVLEAGGYRVGIMPQPDWRRREEFQRFGRPRLFFGVTAGNLDSMVANYSPQMRPRREDV